jgi:hypothetical protein
LSGRAEADHCVPVDPIVAIILDGVELGAELKHQCLFQDRGVAGELRQPRTSLGRKDGALMPCGWLPGIDVRLYQRRDMVCADPRRVVGAGRQA